MIKRLKKIKNYLYWASKGEYNPDKLWNEWGKTFIDDPIQQKIYPQHEWLLKILNKEKPKNLLEVGCGFGRNIRYILENYRYPIRITGVDISSSMLISAKKYLKDYLKPKHSKVELKKGSILDLPFENHTFEVVLCHGVLMHVKPNEIKKAVREIFRISSNKLVLVEQNDAIKPLKGRPYQKINYYTYTYPYKSLFQLEGRKIEEFRRLRELDWFLIKI